SGGGPLHFRLKLVQLFLHEGGEASSGRKPDVIGMQDVALGDCVRDVGRQLRIGRTVTDKQQVGIRRARDLQTTELYGSILHTGRGEFAIETCSLVAR